MGYRVNVQTGEVLSFEGGRYPGDPDEVQFIDQDDTLLRRGGSVELLKFDGQQVVPKTPAEKTDVIRRDAKIRVRDFAESIRRQFLDSEFVTATEIAAWPNKAERARRALTDGASAEDLAILQAEVDQRQRGETLAELATLQLAKEARLSEIYGLIDGMKKRVFEAIDTTDHEGIEPLLDSLKQEAEALLASVMNQ